MKSPIVTYPVSASKPPVSTVAAFLAAVTLSCSALAGLPANAQGVSSADPPGAAGGVAHTLRPTIAVLSVSDSDGSGRPQGANSQSDIRTLTLAEQAITRSHAFNLYSRDLLTEQTKEMKMNAEGFVDPATAQAFGKSKGIERFLQVLISNPTVARIVGQDVSEYTVPTNGDPVTGTIYIESPDDSTSGGLFKPPKNNKKQAPPTRRNLIQAKATITCRFTSVATGARETESFDGIATADAGHGDDRRVREAAIDDAFDNFRKSLSKNRTQMMGNVTEVAEGKAIIDLGADEGITKNMAFEICEVKKVGSFVTYSPVCDARVAAVNQNSALLDLGEYKKQIFHPEPVFHEDGGKAKLVHPGYVIREKKF